jgi:Ca-activated chloride channel family protein
VTVRSSAKIKNAYSPSHDVEIKRPDEHTAVVRHTAANKTPASDFRLMYDVGKGAVGASLLSYLPCHEEDGYFLLLLSPEIERLAAEKAVAKSIVFVVDRSGSMSGKKIEQAKGALRFVLNNLNEGDLFNVVAYDSEVESFQPELQRYSDATRKQALGFVETIHAGGSTNIDGALQSALKQLQDDSRPNYIVFLTDGLPTSGVRNESRIVANATKQNQVRARVFSFGVGFDVNSRLLEKLSRACFGQSVFVRPNEDIEEHVSRLYNRIGAPVMTNVDIRVDMEGFGGERGPVTNRLYAHDQYDLFAGDQLVFVGRYRDGGAARIRLTGAVGSGQQVFEFPVQFVENSSDETNAFIEKLWALRRVGEIIDEIDLQGKNDELVNELVALATKHGIVTPYTSFLADETVNVQDFSELRFRAAGQLDSLQDQAGRAGFVQRELKLNLQQAGQRGAAVGGWGRRLW